MHNKIKRDLNAMRWPKQVPETKKNTLVEKLVKYE